MKTQKQINNIQVITVYIVIICLFLTKGLYAQNDFHHDESHFEKGKYLVNHFTSKEYQAGISNWSTVQDKRGILYFGNQSGVLEFDGTEWRLIKVANYSTVYSLAISSQGVIYVGAVGEIGYLAPDSIGTIRYHSLLDKLPIQNRDFEKVENIVTNGNFIYFHSEEGIIKWDGEKMTFFTANNLKLYKVDNNIIVSGFDSSSSDLVEKLKKEGFQYIDNRILKNGHHLMSVLPFDDKNLLVTDNSGESYLYKLNSSGRESDLVHFTNNALDMLKHKKIRLGYQTPEGNLAFSIEDRGVYILNSDGIILNVIDKESGLPNSSVQSIFFDSEGNLWLGLNHGIAKVSFAPEFNYWDENLGLFGETNAITRYNNIIFIATNLGLYYIKNKPDEISRIIKIKEIKGNCSSLLSFKNKYKNILLIGSEDGIYEINLDSNNQLKVSHPSKLSRVKKLLSFHTNKGVLAIKGNSIYLLKSLGNEWDKPIEIKHFRENINQATYSFIGDLWIVTESGDLFKVKETEGESLGFISYEYDFLKGDIGHRPISIISTKEKLYIQTQKDLFKYHPAKDIFLRKANSNVFDDENAQIVFFKETKNDNFWALNRNQSQLIPTLYQNNGDNFKSFSFNKASIINHDNISKDDILYIEDHNDVLWLGGVHKLFRIDRHKIDTLKNRPVTLIRKVLTTSGEVLFDGGIAHREKVNRIKYNQNNLAFYFALPGFADKDIQQFSVRLHGHDEEWSEWFPENKIIYSSLQAGEYIFHVKGKGYNNIEGEIATFRFIVIAPWYQSTSAYIIYILFLISSVWVIVKANTYRLKKDKERLEKVIDQRTSEIVKQKEKIEAQRNLLAEKNEEIQNQNENLKSIQEHIEVANIELISNNLELEQEVAKRALIYLENSKEMDRLNRELDTFIYRASHDLKGPVASMQGLSKLMEMIVSDPDVKLYLTKFIDSLENMDETISKLVLINGITQSQLQLTKVSFESLIAELKQPYLEKVKRNNIRFEVAISPDIDFYSDEYFLRVILTNLLDNAVTYYRSSQRIESYIKLQINQTDQRLNIVIEDNGSGIPKEDYTKVFQMFYKGSELSHGNGLGLYIVKKAIEKLDGTISLESKEGAATKISIMLSNENQPSGQA